MSPHPSSHPLLRVTLLLAGIAILFSIASFFPDLVLALILSGLSAFVLNPAVSLFEARLGMRRTPAIAIIFLSVGGALVYTLSILVPFLVRRLQSIYDQIKVFPFDAKLADLTYGLESTLPFIDSKALAGSIRAFIDRSLDGAGSAVEDSLGTILMLAIVPFVTYFILADGPRTFSLLIERIPNRYFEMTLNVYHKIRRQLVRYLRGWMLDSMIVGFLTIIGLWIVGIDHAIIIGCTAGIANLVPYLGPLVAAGLAILMSLVQTGDFRMVAPILAVTVVIRLLDDFIVQPLCFARSLNMRPLTVILLLVIGHETLGVTGMLVAIPLATILKVTAVETYWGLKNYRITA